ncbi:MAG: ABC transporter ATP-binding protein [Deltaproteobacteria bacterium SG8_13]|nr:MAG: ABC transporter ATP-binding protein [Deltaproteobacteria bacterium SG8_13]
MGTKKTPVVQKSLFSWVLASNLKIQGFLVFIILITVFARVVPLEMQKRVVNEAINLRRVDLLLIYCGIYLVAVITQGLFKLIINYMQARIGQRALAEMRKELYHHILTLPLGFFRKTQPGLVVASLITELTTSGSFVGMAIAVPVTNILTLLAFAGYLFWLNPLLALISLSIYPLVLFLVPMLQRRANEQNKRRVDATRVLSGRIAESASGIHEIQGNGAFALENNKFDHLVDKLMNIRVVWTLYSEGIKLLNNFFTNLSPLLVFSLGGYLAMTGRLELGALVAFLSAQEKLYQPWKDLIEFYQVYQDASVSYGRTMEYFNLEPEHELAPSDRKPYDLEGSLEVSNLSFTVEGGIRLLNDISLSLKPGEQLGLVGFSGSGKSTLAQCIGQLYKYTGGQIQLGGKEVADLTKKDIINNVGFVSQSPFIFSGTIEENLLYGCMASSEGNGAKGDGTIPSLDDIIAVLQQTGIFIDVLRFGLNTILAQDRDQKLVETILRVRTNFQRRFGQELAEYVEFFDENRYLFFSSVIENLTFGTSNRQAYETEFIADNPEFVLLLERFQLSLPLLSLGIRLAEQTIDILGDLPPEEFFFEQSPILPDELDTYRQVVARTKKENLNRIGPKDRTRLLQLALRFTPGIHKMVALPEVLESLILNGRAMFREKILAEDPEAFTFYENSGYIFSQTILNNIFFGKMKSTNPRAQEKINQSIVHLLIEEDFLETIVEIGLQYQVGSKGDKLSGGQRQKLAIARMLLKAPRVMIMDEATSALDNKSQTRIQNLLETHWKGKSTLIAVAHRLDTIKNFDRIAVLKAGKIGEIGPYDELIARKGLLYELEFGKK